MWLMTVLKASVSSYSFVNTTQSMSVVCRAQNTNIGKFDDNLSFVQGNLTSKIVYTCADYNTAVLYCEERAESKCVLDQMFSSGLYPLIIRPTQDNRHDCYYNR